MVRSAEVVACTLSSAGGDLLSLVKGAGSDPSMLFQAIMIDEVLHASDNPLRYAMYCKMLIVVLNCQQHGARQGVGTRGRGGRRVR